MPSSCADITHARQLGFVGLVADGPVVQILADDQCLGAQTGGSVVTPPVNTFKKNALDWCEPIHQQQLKAHSLWYIRVEHSIANLKNACSRATWDAASTKAYC